MELYFPKIQPPVTSAIATEKASLFIKQLHDLYGLE